MALHPPSIAWLVLSVSGCERGGVPDALPSASASVRLPQVLASPRQSGAPGARATAAPSSSESPLPGYDSAELLACKGMADRGFEVKLEGDGGPQLMREGARVETLSGALRYCTAAGRNLAPHLTLFACAARADAKKSCIVIAADSAHYLDRAGASWSLELAQVDRAVQGDVLEGRAALLARRAGISKKLLATFRVGTQIPAVPEVQSPYFNPELSETGP